MSEKAKQKSIIHIFFVKDLGPKHIVDTARHMCTWMDDYMNTILT